MIKIIIICYDTSFHHSSNENFLELIEEKSYDRFWCPAATDSNRNATMRIAATVMTCFMSRKFFTENNFLLKKFTLHICIFRVLYTHRSQTKRVLFRKRRL